jgi:hypothetical protein
MSKVTGMLGAGSARVSRQYLHPLAQVREQEASGAHPLRLLRNSDLNGHDWPLSGSVSS